MPTYVYLVILTEKGKSNLEEVRKNSVMLNKYIEELGGRNQCDFMTLGRYDIVRIVQMPNDISALQLSMRSSETGLEKVETLKGFTSDEMKFSVI